VRSLLAAAALAAALIALTVGPAFAEPPDPPRNLPIGDLPSACNSPHGATGLTCENAVIYYLDRARAAMGLEPYRLPADFPVLSPDRQIFILSNLDIAAYGVAPVPGLNADLSAAAAQGVVHEGDPEPPAGYPYSGYTSNWAGAFANAAAAYYEWMYDDGPGSGNLDCKGAGDEGCWGHRHNIVGYSAYAGSNAAMGAAAGSTGYAMLIVGREGGPPPYYYTWAEAQADGAGSNLYDPGVPSLAEAEGPITPRLVLKAQMARQRIVAIAIEADPLLIGHRAEVQLRRQRVACGRQAPASCRWVQSGKKGRRHLTLSGTSKVRVPRLGRFERLTVRVRTKPFGFEGLRYRTASSSITLR
jgi:hypothetical protein